MKNSSIAFALLLILMVSCKSDDKTAAGDKAKDGQVAAEGTYTINRDDSRLVWKGSEDEGKEFHEGEMKLVSGSILVSGGKIVSGEMVCDLESINIYDLEGKKDRHEKLKNHFLDPDFFAADDGTIENPKVALLEVDGSNAKLRVKVRNMDIDITAAVTITMSDNQILVDAAPFKVNFMPFAMPFFQKLDPEVSISVHLVFNLQ